MKKSCEICGRETARNTMIVRKLNGREHYCCGLSCEVRWEKNNLVGICG